MSETAVSGPAYSGPKHRVVKWPNWEHVKMSPAGYRFYKSKARKILFNAGRARGKDFDVHFRSIALGWWLYYKRKNDPKWWRPGPVLHIGLPAPTTTNSADHWRRIKDMLPQFPRNAVAENGNPLIHVRESAKEIEIFGENEFLISFSSTFVGANVRGGGFDILGGTEVAYMKEADVREALLPLVIRPGFPEYYVMFNSTPRNNWWDRAVEQARKGIDYWGTWELHEGTYADNPMTTDEQVQEFLLERQENIYSYRRERLAWIHQPVIDSATLSGEGTTLAFPPETIAAVQLTGQVQFIKPFYIGIDLAGAGPDALTVVVIDGNGVVCHLEKHSKSDTEYIVDLVNRLNAYWRPRAIHYDGNGKLGKEVRGRLRQAVCKPVITADKAELVMHLEAHFLQKSIRLPNHEFWAPQGRYQRENLVEMTQELREYREVRIKKEIFVNQRTREKEFTTFSKPPGGSDDWVDALVYASQGIPVPRRERDIELSTQEDVEPFSPVRLRPVRAGLSEADLW